MRRGRLKLRKDTNVSSWKLHQSKYYAETFLENNRPLFIVFKWIFPLAQHYESRQKAKLSFSLKEIWTFRLKNTTYWLKSYMHWRNEHFLHIKEIWCSKNSNISLRKHLRKLRKAINKIEIFKLPTTLDHRIRKSWRP